MTLFFKSGALAYCPPPQKKSFSIFPVRAARRRHVRKETQLGSPFVIQGILTLCNCTPHISECITFLQSPIRVVKIHPWIFTFNNAFQGVHYEEHTHLCSMTVSHGVLISYDTVSLMHYLLFRWVFATKDQREQDRTGVEVMFCST